MALHGGGGSSGGGGPGSDTTAFHQGGDAFGADATLGTNDAQDLIIELSGTPEWKFVQGGTLLPLSYGGLGDFNTPLSLIASGQLCAINTPGDNYASAVISGSNIAFGDGAVIADATIYRDGTTHELMATTTSGTYALTPPAAGSSPLTTKGDLFTFSSVNARLAVGTNNFALIADSAAATGNKWAAVDETILSTSDITTLNASTSKHGFLKKLDNDATHFMDGTGAWAAVTDADLSTSDITTNNASTSKHGLLKKLDNNVAHYMDGTGAWSTPPGAFSAADVDLLCQGRLTLATGDPAPIADQTGKSTVYFTPYKGNRVALYTGSVWELVAFSEISIALSGLTSGKNYDVFAYNNSGTLALELSAAWTNDTTRADAVVYQDGVRVKSSDKTRRLVGRIFTTGTTTTESSQINRCVINENHKLSTPMFTCPGYADDNSPTSYATTSTTLAAVNSGTGATLSFLSDGLSAIDCLAQMLHVVTEYGVIGIGVDGADPERASYVRASGIFIVENVTSYNAVLTEGKHTFTFMFAVYSTGTCTAYADLGRLNGTAADLKTTYMNARVNM